LNDLPLVSVILPVFNGAAFVADAMRSVLEQTYRDLELLVVNDGSTDATSVVVSAFSDERLTVVAQENHGLAAARNVGVQRARGAVVAFIDADDLWHPQHLERLVPIVAEGRLVHTAFYLREYQTGAWLGDFTRFDRFRGERGDLGGHVFLSLLKQNFMSPSGVVMMRRDLLNVGGFTPTLASHEDWDCWLRCAERFEFVLVAEPRVIVRVRRDSLQGDRTMMRLSGRQVLDAVWERSTRSRQRDPDFRGSLGLGYFATRNMKPAARHLLAAVLRDPARIRWWRWLAASIVWRPIRSLKPAADVRD
jgi:glycosyltransferase involved in cell wall biosynthesis